MNIGGNGFKFFGLFILFFLVPGCFSGHYKVRKLKPLDRQTAQFVEKKEDVKVLVSALSEARTKKIFGQELNNGKKYLCPIQITVKNKSDKVWLLGNKGIDLKMIPSDQVAKLLRYHTWARFATWSAVYVGFVVVLAPFILVISFAGAAAGAFLGYVGEVAGYTLLGLATVALAFSGPFFIATDCVTCSKQNAQIENDFKKKTGFEGLILLPGKSKNLLIFVNEQDYKTNFSIDLNSLAGDKNLHFDVVLEKPVEPHARANLLGYINI